MEKTYIGQGCSRIAYLLPDGRVEKRPRYNASHSSAHAGSPDYVILDELLFEFRHNTSIQKVRKLLDKDYEIPPQCAGILIEYLVSLKLKKERKGTRYFALCEEIQVRKRNSLDEIGIVGIFENGKEKASKNKRILKEGFTLDRKVYNFQIADLHNGNMIDRKVIVDYACVHDF